MKTKIKRGDAGNGLFGKVRNLYFVGIGGTGMSGIAEILIQLGFNVAGSDLNRTPLTDRLSSMGADIVQGHDSDKILSSDVAIVSTAVPHDNPEIRKADASGITIIPRSEMLGGLMRLKKGVAIAGAHGKTTVTSITGHLLSLGGIDPTIIVGGRLQATGSGGKLGAGEWLVAEACESDGTFLELTPCISVITSIDREHLDYYPGIEEIKAAFLDFASRVPFFGLLVLCLDDPHVQAIMPQIKRRFETYGISAQADMTASSIRLEKGKTCFDLEYRGEKLGRAVSPLPGIHNIGNALAAALVAHELEIPAETILEGLATFDGVGRRFEFKGNVGGVAVYDDYGHHPTEIEATLQAARGRSSGRVIAIVQPHRYSRVKALPDEFSRCFNASDMLFLTEIHAAGEKPIQGVSGRELAAAVQAHGHRQVVYVPSVGEIPAEVAPRLRRDDLVITLGAGDIWKSGEKLLDLLSSAGGKSGKGAGNNG